ncbi:MAG TPA: hypothetical protein DCF97_07065, partial [Plesiomonas shigelloides]|nr:hypothetical protein [Plesiomonas shigelloides]
MFLALIGAAVSVKDNQDVAIFRWSPVEPVTQFASFVLSGAPRMAWHCPRRQQHARLERRADHQHTACRQCFASRQS